MVLGGRWAIALGGLLFLSSPAGALTNLFFTAFEPSEGYDARYELVSQNGWVCDTTSLGGNGLTTNYLGTQAAYVGLFPLDPATNFISVYQPLSFDPIQQGLPIVEFSTLMSVMDSSNTNWDDFLWTVYNTDGWPMLTVDFNNYDTNIYYALGTNDFVATPVRFANDVSYDFRIRMDFALNRWSATLSGTLIVTNQPIAPAGKKLDLADVDAVWWPYDPVNPGDNFMVFDNYKVTADALPPIQLAGLGRNPNGQFLLRLYGPSGTRHAIEASANLRQWTSLKTNVVTDGYFDFIDTDAASLSRRYYRARLVN